MIAAAGQDVADAFDPNNAQAAADGRGECRCAERGRCAIDTSPPKDRRARGRTPPAARRGAFGLAKADAAKRARRPKRLSSRRCKRDLAALKASLQAQPITRENLPADLVATG